MARDPKRIAADVTLKRCFPPDITPPQLLFDFAEWLSACTMREQGSYRIKPRSPQDFVPPGVQIENDLAMCMEIGDGSLAGLWFGQTRDPDRAPFVVLGSEGGLDILAPNLACMLHRIAIDALDEDYEEGDFAFRANKPALTKALLAWLRAHPVAWPIIEATQPEDYTNCDDNSADRWLQEILRRFEEGQDRDPDLLAIAALLTNAGYVPEPIDLSELAAGLETYDDLFTSERDAEDDEDEAVDDDPAFYTPPEVFQVFAAGDRMRILNGAALLPEIADTLVAIPAPLEKALCPHLWSLRETLATETPGKGLWPAADLELHANGAVMLKPRWSHPYAIGYEGFPPEAFAADQARVPRAKRKLAAWHKELLDKVGR